MKNLYCIEKQGDEKQGKTRGQKTRGQAPCLEKRCTCPPVFHDKWKKQTGSVS